MAGPKLPDINALTQAGIDPRTGLPIKFRGMLDGTASKEEIKKCLRIIDEQDAVNRYVWYNLPNNLTSQELERMLYYKGQLCFFYMKELDEFYFMPYALDGTIDFYGRFKRIHPVPMTSGTDDKNGKAQAELLSNLKLFPQYGIKIDTPTEKDMEESCVLIHDYTKQLSQTIIPRVTLQEPILDIMSECIPYMSLNLLIATGISGVRVNGADERENVKEGARDLKRSALSGQPWVAIEGKVDFQELSAGSVAKSEEYMLAMQSLDNFRLGTYGIENGGLFEKKAHVLEGEQAVNGGPVGLVMQDGLSIRQNFCNIVNSIWGLGIWCEPSENINGMDMDGDGDAYDDNYDGSNSGKEGDNDNE